jgi:hypothetical protein
VPFKANQDRRHRIPLPLASRGARMEIGVPVSSRTASAVVEMAGLAYSACVTWPEGSKKSSKLLPFP